MTHTAPLSAQAPRYARVLSIAGSDSGGGAGIQADLKTFSALGCYGMTAITAITAQNTQGVRAIHGVPPEMLRAQIEAVVEDIGVDAVKIGMLHSPEVVAVVADALRRYQLLHVVLDPVMVATSGDRLMADETVQVLVRELFPLATVVTPNLDEAALLLGRAIPGIEALDDAARALLALGAPAVLLKGGHLPGDEVVDVLALPGGTLQYLRSPRIWPWAMRCPRPWRWRARIFWALSRQVRPCVPARATAHSTTVMRPWRSVSSRADCQGFLRPSQAASGHLCELAAQVADDFFGVVEPAAVARFVGDLQARYLRLAALLHQCSPVGAFRLRVHFGDRQGQAAHFLAHLDAKRAGFVLVQRQAFACLVNGFLPRRRAHDALGAGERLFEKHHRAQDNAQGLEKESDKRFHGPF